MSQSENCKRISLTELERMSTYLLKYICFLTLFAITQQQKSLNSLNSNNHLSWHLTELQFV